MRITPAARPWVPYALVTTVHLLLLAGAHPLAHWTHLLLMPALVWPATRVRDPLRPWVLGAVAFSWLGDSLPRLVEGPSAFLLLAGSFLVAHLLWIGGLVNRRALTLPARRRATGVLYAVAALGIAGLAAPFAGAFAPVIVVFAVAVTCTAVLGSSMGERGTWGGALIMLSDALLALDRFVPGFDFPGQDVLIMFSYALAQGLLVGAAGRIGDPRHPRLGDTD